MKKIPSPQFLWDAAQAYFREVENNPTIKLVPIMSGDLAGTFIPVPTPMAYTLNGLQMFLGVHRTTYYRYRSDVGYEQFFDVCEMIDKIIYDRNYTYAVTGFFSANVISRELGLKNKSKKNSAEAVAKEAFTGTEII